MRYYIRNDTLFIRGCFSAASTGPCGGLRPVSTVLLYSPGQPREAHGDSCREVVNQVSREGLPGDFFGLIAGNDIGRLCIVQYDYITVFIQASAGGNDQPDQITIVAYSGEGLAENAILQMIVTVTSAKARYSSMQGCRSLLLQMTRLLWCLNRRPVIWRQDFSQRLDGVYLSAYYLVFPVR